MRTFPALLALLAACTTPLGLYEATTPPPTRITLHVMSEAVAGGPWYLRVTGLPRRAPLELRASADVTGPGWCPPALAPLCVDLADSGYVLGTGQADGAGVAELRVVLPEGVPGQIEVMARSWWRGSPYASNGVVVDVLEAAVDTDGDGRVNLDEAWAGSDPQLVDTDGDGLGDGEEFLWGTSPRSHDTDGDGLDDPDEVVRGTSPVLPDTDGDDQTDGEEVADGTDPLNPDTDGDNLDDGEEADLQLDPLLADSDADGIDDGSELWLCFFNPNCPDPHVADTDGDSVLDGEERALGTSFVHRDTDRDGLDDSEARLYGTDPLAPDTDGGFALDGLEVRSGTDPFSPLDDPGSVLVNEVDINQSGADRQEFIELFNPGTTSVDLQDLALVLVDARQLVEYARYDLFGVLPAGGYLLIAPARVAAPPGTLRLPLAPATDGVLNGPVGGVAVVDVAAFEVRDALIYGGGVAGDITLAGFPGPLDLVEHLPAIFTDTGVGDVTIARTPNGLDRNMNEVDFALGAPTPGAPN